jgi:DNA-binding transcriptional ArsR family regulator
MQLTKQMTDIIEGMSAITGVDVLYILNEKRTKKALVVMCRSLIADLFHREFKLTLGKVGEIFHVDHSTISHYLAIVERNKGITYDKYKFYYEAIEIIWKRVSSN